MNLIESINNIFIKNKNDSAKAVPPYPFREMEQSLGVKIRLR